MHSVQFSVVLLAGHTDLHPLFIARKKIVCSAASRQRPHEKPFNFEVRVVTEQFSRRKILQSAAATGVALLPVSSAWAEEESPVYRVGLIGCGWYGGFDLRHLMEIAPQINVVSLCDVDSRFLKETADRVEKRQGTRPALFGDYRNMLAAKKLDIVIVGTPDHWHALQTIAAIESGADVYVEKPISHTFQEGRAMVQAARKHNRVVQVGMQRRSTDHIQSARKFIQEGNIGKIGEVKSFCYIRERANEKAKEIVPPEYLDYDMWTGPAPLLPYQGLMHPQTWRLFEEFSNGLLGDMGVHMLDVMRWIMDVKYPQQIYSTGGIYVDKGGVANVPDTQTVTYKFEDFTATWEHRCYGVSDFEKNGWGVHFYGELGVLELGIESWNFRPLFDTTKPRSEKAKVDPDSPHRLDRPGRQHKRDFLKAVAERTRPIADIEEGHYSTALCLLGTISQRLGRSLDWDAENERFINDDEANLLLKRKYRAPWKYPEVTV